MAIKRKATDIQPGEDVVSLLHIEQMDCPTEESLIRAKLSGLSFIGELHFHLVQRNLSIRHEQGAQPKILAELKAIGFDAQLTEPEFRSPEARPSQRNWWLLAGAGVLAFLAEAASWFGGGYRWVELVFALGAIALGGLTTFKKGWLAVRGGLLNMNALMSVAVTGAILIGHWPEAAMVMVLFTLAEKIEALSLERARRAIGELMDLTPETATVRQPDNSWNEMDVRQVKRGDMVRVRPGERIALDGRIVRGQSAVNQAPITGESLPVEKGPGDTVLAGSINEAGALEFSVSADVNNSTVARIIRSVETALGNRAPTQRFVDRFASVYTPAIFSIAVGVALVPPLVVGGAWLDWVYRALVLLVIGCPCALVISTPVSIVAGLTRAARQGILIKGGAFLEKGHTLQWLALDKTGTITLGKPAQTDFVPWQDANPQTSRIIAASLASRSDHPVSHALAEAAQKENLALREVSDFAALPGRGIRGMVDGEIYHLGNHRLVEELGKCSRELEEHLNAYESAGKTAVVLVGERGVIAHFAVADTIRDTSREAIQALHRLGVKTVMLTGDNPLTGQTIANQVGIDRVLGNLLPEDKQREVETLTKTGTVGMVGDGINDAPALARADIGFAMGTAGTDTAIETADVALMEDDLRKVATFVMLSRKTSHILKQNIALALGIKAFFLVLTAFGAATMWMAVFADMGVSLIVVFNGMRLLKA